MVAAERAACRALLLALLACAAWRPVQAARNLAQASAAPAPGPAPPPSQPCAAADAALLLAFRDSFENGAQVLNTWRPGSDCCAWTGISCDAAGNVTALVSEAGRTPCRLTPPCLALLREADSPQPLLAEPAPASINLHACRWVHRQRVVLCHPRQTPPALPAAALLPPRSSACRSCSTGGFGAAFPSRRVGVAGEHKRPVHWQHHGRCGDRQPNHWAHPAGMEAARRRAGGA